MGAKRCRLWAVAPMGRSYMKSDAAAQHGAAA